MSVSGARYPPLSGDDFSEIHVREGRAPPFMSVARANQYPGSPKAQSRHKSRRYESVRTGVRFRRVPFPPVRRRFGCGNLTAVPMVAGVLIRSRLAFD